MVKEKIYDGARELEGGFDGLGAAVHGQHAKLAIVAKVVSNVLAEYAKLVIVEGA